jgi:transcriptional regulator with XRE-family HTH domain
MRSQPTGIGYLQRRRMVKIKVKEILQSRNVSMSKLSRLSDVSFSTISRICNDPLYSPTLNTLERIAKSLGIAISDLYEEIPDNKGNTNTDNNRH